jgi:hypothetical protein
MSAPHRPNAAQLTQLASLQTTVQTRLSAYQTNIANGKLLKAALQKAQNAYTDYQAYIFGGNPVGVLDNGNQEAV